MSGRSGPAILAVRADRPELAAIAEAARILRAGGLVVFPTETVYGLGADAASPAAIERLNRVKGRPPEKPYSLHVGSRAQAEALIPSLPPQAARLMDAFWPGPLTIVVPGPHGSIGLRLPNHPVALAFLRACGVPVAAPSANRSGSSPPTDPREAIAALGNDVDCVLDSGPTPMGRESTVVDVREGKVEIRREGAVSAAAVQAALEGSSR